MSYAKHLERQCRAAFRAEREAWFAVRQSLPGSPQFSAQQWGAWLEAVSHANAAVRLRGEAVVAESLAALREPRPLARVEHGPR